MTHTTGKVLDKKFSVSSCIKSDVWHPEKKPAGYEWWYFDALSDDGTEAVVIIFLENFIFSPGYNSINHKNNTQNRQKFPALAFIYYRNGKPVYRTINEFSEDDFSADTKNPECRIGQNSFHFESAPYGSGYVLEIKQKLYKNRRLEARFEWLSVESNLKPADAEISENSHFWNLVAPRSDVTGRISVFGRRGRKRDEINFRGTGYHDHNLDNRWLPATVKEWQWGRSHFTDTTAVFYRYCETGKTADKQILSKLFLIQNDELIEKDAVYEIQETGRDKFGLKYPKRLRITAGEDIKLRVKQEQLIDSSFFYLRFLSEMTLTLRDGKPRKTIGISEHLAPKSLKYRWLDWLIKMRIGRNGKSSFLP